MSVEVHGFCEPGFEPLREAFTANFAEGLEMGASVGACIRGRPVVDLWAGFADFQRTRPWEADTIVLMNSSTKIPLLICVLMLLDRGLIALDQPVSTYWPQFAAGGKGAATIRDVLTHQAGVPALDPAPTHEEYCEWETITGRIAAEPHWFGGERRIAYHIVTSGFILGEVMRRVDGRRPAQFFREEIGEPAGIDLQIGIHDPSELKRVAGLGSTAEPPPARTDPLAARMLNSLPRGSASWKSISSEWPSGNAYSNGRAMARVASILANDGVLDGRRYLSQAIVREALSPQAEGEEPVFGRLTLGLMVCRDSAFFPLPTPTSVYWGGNGGSLCVMDPKTGLSFGYAMNNMLPGGLGEGVRFNNFWRALTKVMSAL